MTGSGLVVHSIHDTFISRVISRTLSKSSTSHLQHSLPQGVTKSSVAAHLIFLMAFGMLFTVPLHTSPSTPDAILFSNCKLR